MRNEFSVNFWRIPHPSVLPGCNNINTERPYGFGWQLLIKMSPSLIFTLPPELRLRIWELVLASPEPIHIQYRPPYILEPPLTFVNRRLRAEILPVFYSQATFQIPSLSSLWAFLIWLSPRKSAFLRDVRLKRGFWSWDRRWRYVESAALAKGALRMEVFVPEREEWVWMEEGEFEELWAGK